MRLPKVYRKSSKWPNYSAKVSRPAEAYAAMIAAALTGKK